MKLWDLINSDFSITLLSFLLGGIIVTWLSSMLQRKSQKHSVRLLFIRELIGIYHDYIRFLRRDEKINNYEEFDELHTEMLSKSYMANIIFDEELGKDIRSLANKLCTCQQLREEGKLVKAEQQRVGITKDGQSIIERLYTYIN